MNTTEKLPRSLRYLSTLFPYPRCRCCAPNQALLYALVDNYSKKSQYRFGLRDDDFARRFDRSRFFVQQHYPIAAEYIVIFKLNKYCIEKQVFPDLETLKSKLNTRHLGLTDEMIMNTLNKMKRLLEPAAAAAAATLAATSTSPMLPSSLPPLLPLASSSSSATAASSSPVNTTSSLVSAAVAASPLPEKQKRKRRRNKDKEGSPEDGEEGETPGGSINGLNMGGTPGEGGEEGEVDEEWIEELSVPRRRELIQRMASKLPQQDLQGVLTELHRIHQSKRTKGWYALGERQRENRFNSAWKALVTELGNITDLEVLQFLLRKRKKEVLSYLLQEFTDDVKRALGEKTGEIPLRKRRRRAASTSSLLPGPTPSASLIRTSSSTTPSSVSSSLNPTNPGSVPLQHPQHPQHPQLSQHPQQLPLVQHPQHPQLPQLPQHLSHPHPHPHSHLGQQSQPQPSAGPTHQTTAGGVPSRPDLWTMVSTSDSDSDSE